MKTFIIVLHFGDPKVTEDCLESILKHEKKFEEIIIVDNDTNLRFKIYDLRFKNKIKIIRNEKNLGYAEGMNVGIKYALAKGATHILLLNNDTIFEKPVLSSLVKFLMNQKDAGIVGPAIKFDKNGKIVFDLGGKVNMWLGKTKHTEFSSKDFKKVSPCFARRDLKTDYVSGCCLFIKKEVLEKIGLFDNDYFLYYEDVDFCLRAKKAGFNTYCLPSVYIVHSLSKAVGKDSSKAIYNQIKSALIFGRKHIKNKIFNKIFVFTQSTYLFLKNPINGISAFKAIFEL